MSKHSKDLLAIFLLLAVIVAGVSQLWTPQHDAVADTNVFPGPSTGTPGGDLGSLQMNLGGAFGGVSVFQKPSTGITWIEARIGGTGVTLFTARPSGTSLFSVSGRLAEETPTTGVTLWARYDTSTTGTTNAATYRAPVGDPSGVSLAGNLQAEKITAPVARLETVATAALNLDAAATPGWTFRDSGNPGADKEIARLYADYVDGADGAENGDFFLQAMQGGSEHTFLQFDESDDQVEIKDDLDMESNALKVASGSLTIPASNGDVALASAGGFAYDEVDDAFAVYDSQGGEVTGEVQISVIDHIALTFDPAWAYDQDANHRVALFTIGDDYPNGIIIDEWRVSYLADPTTELDANLKYADAFIGVANAALIDALDTTNGASTEDTDASINGGAAVANGKVIYIEFDADPTDANVELCFEMWFHAEED